jgi:hypothetical protein
MGRKTEHLTSPVIETEEELETEEGMKHTLSSPIETKAETEKDIESSIPLSTDVKTNWLQRLLPKMPVTDVNLSKITLLPHLIDFIYTNIAETIVKLQNTILNTQQKFRRNYREYTHTKDTEDIQSKFKGSVVKTEAAIHQHNKLCEMARQSLPPPQANLMIAIYTQKLIELLKELGVKVEINDQGNFTLKNNKAPK